MKEKFLHKRDFGTIFLLMIGLFLMLFPNTAKAQSYTDDTRFAVTVKQSGDIVTMEAFFVGPALIDAATWGLFYDPAMLQLYDTLLTTPLSYYGEASASMDDFDDVLKFQGLFLNEGFTFMGDGFHYPAMDIDDSPPDEKYSGNHFMNVFYISVSPGLSMNVISVAQGEVIPFFTCYFKKISEDPLTSAHFGIGAGFENASVYYASSILDYTNFTSVGYVDIGTYDVTNSDVFLYRSPSHVISKSAVTTQNSATLTGTFASWSMPPSETLFDGETEGSGTIANYKAGRLRGDTIRSRGFIYTEANADVDFTFSEFSPMATINGVTINLRDSIANGSNSFTAGGNIYRVVTANSSTFYADATDYSATVNGLTEDEEYYAWAFGLYTFETSNVFAAVGERLEFTITATRCDLQAGSVYITAYPSCLASAGNRLPVQKLSDILTSDDDQGTVNITVTGGSGAYEYTYTKYGEDSVREYSDLHLVNGAEYYIGGLEVGTYRFYIRDKNNPSCEVVSESVVLGTQAYGAATEFLTEVSDASACGQPDGRITFQMTPFSDDYFDDHAVAFYVNGEKLPETAVVEGTIISGTYTISNLAPGTYVLLATFTKDDASLCAVSSQEIRVGARNGGLAVAVDATPESDCEAADGTLAFAITGGAAPYTYQIDGMLVDTTNAATFTVTGLTAGSHVWNIVDATGCRANGRETMDNTANSDFEVQVATTGIACTSGSKGSITLTITGGTAPYFYSCKDTIRHAFNASNTPTLSNLDKGIYDITVYDAEGCVFAYQNVVIDDEPIVMGVGTIYAQQQPTCDNSDGSIYVEVTGDYNNYAYSLYLDGDDLKSGTLSGGVGTISGLGAGTYYVEISAESPNNCGFVYSEPLVLTNADSYLKLVAFAHDADACGTPTGNISFQTTGGYSSNYTYFINGQPTSVYDGQSTGTILNQSPGSYVISVSDQQCSASSGEIIIGAVNGLAVDLTGMVNATCDNTDGSVQLTVTGGTAPYAYQIDGKQEQYMLNNTAVVTGLASGDHVWTVYDATGCQTEGRVTILNEDENGFFVTATSTDMTCAGDSGTITLNIINGDVNGHYSYTYDSHGSSVNFVGNQVTIKNLTVGNYDITIRDEDNDCDFMVQNIIIGTGTNLQVATINAAQQATSCAGDDGQIYIAVTGGSGYYNYSMQRNNGAIGSVFLGSDTIKGLATGTYRIWVTDLSNPTCGTVVSEPVVITFDGVDYSLLVTGIDPADDCGSATGSIAFNLKYSGSDEYDVYLRGPNTSNSIYVDNASAGDTIIRNLHPGTYVMRVVNTVSGCEITSDEIVIPVESDNLDVTTSVLAHATCDTPTGSFSLKVETVDNTTILYQIDGGETLALLSDSVIVTGLRAGSHAWRVTDVSGCYVAEGSVVIRNSDVPAYALNVTNIEHASCDGSTGGAFTMVVSGGSGDFSYSLDNGKTKFSFANTNSHTLTDLATGSYDIIVYDGNNDNCEYHYQNVQIRLNCETTCPEIGTIYVVQYPDCDDGTGSEEAGLVYLEVTGGSGNYEYTTQAGSTSYEDFPDDGLITINPGTGGVIQVYIRDKNYTDCDIVVSEPIELYSTDVDMKVSYTVVNPTSCGSATGKITVSWVSGPSSTNAILYKNGEYAGVVQTNGYSASFENLSPGIYEVRLQVDQVGVDQDMIGCVAGTGLITLEAAFGGLLVDVVNTTHTICGETNGGFVLNVLSGGASPYTCQIDGKASQTAVGDMITVTDLMAGNHVWKIFDNSGCFTEGRVEILNEDGNGFTVSAETEDAPCGNLFGGSITLTVDGGTAPFEYVYQKYDTTQWTAFASGAKATINNLSPGTYDVYVKDATGCVYEYQNITIEKSESELAAGTIAVVDQPTCNAANGSVQLQASGGNNLYYYYTLNGVESWNLTLPVHVAPLGTGLIENLRAGTYRFYVYDDDNFACGVVVSEPITLINTDSELKLVATSTDASDCDAPDGTITFQTSGGTGSYYYELNGDRILGTAGVATNITYGTISVRPGIYVLTVGTWDENCTATTAEIAIGVENSTFAVTESAISHVTDCSVADGSFVFTVTGGAAPYTYQIDGGEAIVSYDAMITVNNLAAGNHVYTLTDSAACHRYEGRVDIWNEDANGFTATAVATNANCTGTDGSITLTVANGKGAYAYSYNGADWTRFTDNTVTIPNLNEGNYDIEVIDSSNMCTFMIQNVIIEREALAIGTISLTAQPTCAEDEGEIYINVTGGSGNYNYSFDNFVSNTGMPLVNDTIKDLRAGTYRIWVKDNEAVACGVVVSEPITLRALDSDLAIVVTPGDATDCVAKDGSINYTITGSASPVSMLLTSTLTGVSKNYLMPAASGNLSGLTPGAYVLTVTDNAGCTVASSEVVISTVSNSMDVQVAHTASLCGTATGTLLISANGTAPYQYQIDGGAWTQVAGDTILVTGLRAGDHTWHIMGADACFATGHVTIENEDAGTYAVDATPADAYCDGLSGGTILLEVTDGTAPFQYTLDNGQTWKGFAGATDSTFTITGLAVGSYDIIVKDAADCGYERQDVRIDRRTESGLVVGTVRAVSQPTCGNDDGEVYLSVTGAVTPEYSIDGGTTWVLMTDSIIRNLGAGTYRIAVRDKAALACGTTFSESITLENTDSDLRIFNVGTTLADHCTADDGTITFSIDGGTPAYTISLDGNTPANLTGSYVISQVSAGRHILSVEDNRGCVASAEVFIGTQNGMTVSPVITVYPTCDDAKGTLELTISGSSAPFTYQIDGGTVQAETGNVIRIEGLAAGLHSWKVTASDGCYTEDTIRINNTDVDAFVVNVTTTDAACDGLSGGTIAIEVIGGSGSYTYTVNGGDTYGAFYLQDTTLMDLGVGSYDITVKDLTTGCEYIYQNAVINRGTESSLIVGTVRVVTQPTCGNDDGQVYLNVTGALVPQYRVNAGNWITMTDSLISGLGAGTYMFEVRDSLAMACGTTFSESITLENIESDMAITLAVVADADGCGAAGAEGKIWVDVKGHTGTLIYYLDGVANPAMDGDTMINVTAGYHVVSVSDDNCLSSANIVIGGGVNGMTVNSTVDADATCAEAIGAITLEITNGTPPFQYRIDGGTVKYASTSPIAITGLTAGVHNWTVISADSCYASDTIRINNTDPDAFTVNVTTTDASCDGLGGGTITIEVTGTTAPYTYTIDNWKTSYMFHGNDTTLMGLSVGSYDIVVRDANDCEYMYQNAIINRDSENDVEIGTIAIAEQPTCAAPATGSVYLAVTGGSGEYIYATAIDGTYGEFPSNDTIKNLTPGTYVFYIKDKFAQTCGTVVSNPITINSVDTDLGITVAVTNASDCETGDGALTFLVTGGTPDYSYKLNGVDSIPVGSSFPNLAVGSYVLTVTDDNGCVASSSALFIGSDDDPFTATPVLIRNTTCGNAEGAFVIKLSRSDVYQYQLDGAAMGTITGDSIVFANLTAGNYSWWIKDSCNLLEGDFTITNTDAASLAVVATPTNALCDGSAGSIELEVTGGIADFSYSIDNGVNWEDFDAGETSVIIPGLAEGIYDILVKDAANCTYEVSNVRINVDQRLDFNIGTVAVAQQPDCGDPNGKLYLVVTPAGSTYQYSLNNNGVWNPLPANDTIQNVAAGTYRIYVRDNNALACGVMISDPITINPANSTLALNVTANMASACGVADGSLSLVVSGGVAPYTNYTLNGNPVSPVGNSILNLRPGRYIVTVSDDQDCVASSGEVVLGTSGTGLVATATPADDALCLSAEGSFDLKVIAGKAPFMYQVNGGILQTTTHDSVRVTDLAAGAHVWWIMDADSCITTGNVEIENSDKADFVIGITSTNAGCDGTSGTITIAAAGGQSAYSYSLDNGAFIPMATDTVTIAVSVGIYDIIVRDAAGCVVEYNNAEVKNASDLTPPRLLTPQTFCQGATVANLTVLEGTGIVWYDENGNLLNGTETLENGKIYYAAQTVGNCESPRSYVKVIIDDDIVLIAPKLESPQYFCDNTTPTLADMAIPTSLNPANLTWYSNSIGNTNIPTSTPLVDSTLYYVEVSAGGSCVSVTRGVVLVIFKDGIEIDSNFNTPQYFCEGAVVANLEKPNNQVVWYLTQTGGTALDEGAVLIDGMTYYAAQKAGDCESTNRIAVEVILTAPQKPFAPENQSFCDGTNLTLANLRVTGAGIVWYADALLTQKLPLTTPLTETTYYAVQSSGDCEGDAAAITVTFGCFDLAGTIFPFVHRNIPAFDNLFPVTVSLYELPPAGTRGARTVNYIKANNTPLSVTKAVFYDATIHYLPGTPLNPGVMGSPNNPGDTIDFARIGKVRTTVDRTVAAQNQQPIAHIGYYQLKDVGVGEYIMEIKRDGFLPRWVHVIVTNADVNLGHKEILSGDVDNSRNVTVADRSKTISRLTNSMNSLYAPAFDFDGTGNILYWRDLQFVLYDMGALNYTIYVDSYEIYLKTW